MPVVSATNVQPDTRKPLDASVNKDGAAADVIQYGVDEDWLLIEGVHSVYLTDEGRRLAAG